MARQSDVVLRQQGAAAYAGRSEPRAPSPCGEEGKGATAERRATAAAVPMAAAAPVWPPRTHTDRNGRQFRTGMQVLTDAQLRGFEEMKELCGELPLDDASRLSDEDLFLRHFVAARFDAKHAADMIKENMEWRRTSDVANIQQWAKQHLPNNTPFRTHTDGLVGYYGVDKEGFPVWWERPNAASTVDFVNSYGMDYALNWHVACAERMRELPKRLNVDRYTVVVDLKDAAPSMMLFGKVGALLRAQMAMDQAYYPEVMRRMIIINAPFGFSSTFNVVKKLLDPRMHEKIFIGGKRCPGDILSMHVPDESIPTAFGGSAVVDWDRYRMRPRTDGGVFNLSFYNGHMKSMYDRDREREERRQAQSLGGANANADVSASASMHAAASPTTRPAKGVRARLLRKNGTPPGPRTAGTGGDRSTLLSKFERLSCLSPADTTDDLQTCLTVRSEEDIVSPADSPRPPLDPSFRLEVVSPTPIIENAADATSQVSKCERLHDDDTGHADSDGRPLRAGVRSSGPRACGGCCPRSGAACCVVM